MCALGHQVVLPFGGGLSHLQNNPGNVHQILYPRYLRELRRRYGVGEACQEEPIGSWSVTGAAKIFFKYVNLIIPFSHSDSFNGYSLLFQKRPKSLQPGLFPPHLCAPFFPCSQLCSCTVPFQCLKLQTTPIFSGSPRCMYMCFP